MAVAKARRALRSRRAGERFWLKKIPNTRGSGSAMTR